jgi:hypothetical protein
MRSGSRFGYLMVALVVIVAGAAWLVGDLQPSAPPITVRLAASQRSEPAATPAPARAIAGSTARPPATATAGLASLLVLTTPQPTAPKPTATAPAATPTATAPAVTPTPGLEEQYAALVESARAAIDDGDPESGVALLERAQAILPERDEASAALAALTPTPAPVVVNVAPVTVRAAPPVRYSPPPPPAAVEAAPTPAKQPVTR